MHQLEIERVTWRALVQLYNGRVQKRRESASSFEDWSTLLAAETRKGQILLQRTRTKLNKYVCQQSLPLLLVYTEGRFSIVRARPSAFSDSLEDTSLRGRQLLSRKLPGRALLMPLVVSLCCFFIPNL